MAEEIKEQLDDDNEEEEQPEEGPENGREISEAQTGLNKATENEAVPAKEAASFPDKNAPVPETKNVSVKGKKIGGKFKKIPTEILFSPGGVVLIFFALVMEIIDWIPILEIDNLTWELMLEGIFMGLLAVIAHVPFSAMIVPFIIERIPVVSDIVPSFLIRLFF